MDGFRIEKPVWPKGAVVVGDRRSFEMVNCGQDPNECSLLETTILGERFCGRYRMTVAGQMQEPRVRCGGKIADKN